MGASYLNQPFFHREPSTRKRTSPLIAVSNGSLSICCQSANALTGAEDKNLSDASASSRTSHLRPARTEASDDGRLFSGSA